MLICIAGQLASGKNALGDRLIQRLNERQRIGTWVPASFANAVKNIFQDAFNVDRNFIEKWKRIPEAPPGMLKPVRQALQFIGDGFRQIKSDIWIDIALRGEDNKTFCDARYINEAIASKERNGFNILLWRKNFMNSDPNPSEAQLLPLVKWCLETEQDGIIKGKGPYGIEYFDYFIRNDGTLDDLNIRVEKLLPVLEEHFAIH